jgi:hypothetical protein
MPSFFPPQTAVDNKGYLESLVIAASSGQTFHLQKRGREEEIEI